MNLPLDWHGVAAWPWLHKVGVLVCCLLLVVGGAYAVQLRGAGAPLERAVVRGAELQVALHAQAEQAAGLQGQQARLLGMQHRLQGAQARLLADDGLPGLLQAIAQAGRGLLFEQVNVLPPQPQGLYSEVPVHLRVQGDFAALSAFVDALVELPARVTVHDLHLAPLAGRELLRLQLQLKAYASGLPAEAPAASTPGVARDPFAAQPPSSAEFMLERLPLEQVELVGHLADRRGAVALIRVAGALYPLRAGDRLGPDQGRVVRIDAQQVELVEQVWVEGAGWQGRSRVIDANGVVRQGIN